MTEERCDCTRCIEARGDMVGGYPRLLCEMIVCRTCGNKRCPHAADHRNACTNSNDPGQPGSDYPANPWTKASAPSGATGE